MRIVVRVHPGSRQPGVGGTHDGMLVVRVAERAVDGKATAAAVEAVAEAFGIAKREVVLVSGAASRTKTLEIPDAAGGGLDALRSQERGVGARARGPRPSPR
jgi:uncharacterized protein YggU (UPF0235/DUF167 family)